LSTKEPQYKLHFETEESHGRASLGLGANTTWNLDPIRLTFVLSRYKFVARMLAGTDRVLEVGCGDGFASRIVRQNVKHLVVSDFDPIYTQEASKQLTGSFYADTRTHDFIEKPMTDTFDAIYMLDVLEHVRATDQDRMLQNLCTSLRTHGVLIVGIPSLESQKYASPGSKIGHINCKSGADLKTELQSFFHNVFLFSMNDEVVHTGFSPMAHYVFVLCVGPIESRDTFSRGTIQERILRRFNLTSWKLPPDLI
jgi:SAM-dependent methyltransferase